MGAYFPTVFLALKETRASVILRRKARRLRKERGDKDGGRYTARSEVEKVSFAVAMRQSLLRPLSAWNGFYLALLCSRNLYLVLLFSRDKIFALKLAC
jgi:hypothetical protein